MLILMNIMNSIYICTHVYMYTIYQPMYVCIRCRKKFMAFFPLDSL